MAVVRPWGFGSKVCKALGLGGHEVRTIDLHIGCNEIVTATVEIIVTRDQAEELETVLKEYRLEERIMEEKMI